MIDQGEPAEYILGYSIADEKQCFSMDTFNIIPHNILRIKRSVKGALTKIIFAFMLVYIH